MFQKLVQGFDTLFHSSLVQMSHAAGGSLGLDMLNAEAQKVFSSFENNTGVSSTSSGGGSGGNTGAPTGSSSASSSSPAHANSIAAAALGRSIYLYEIAPLVPINPNSVDMLLFQTQMSGASGNNSNSGGQLSSQSQQQGSASSNTGSSGIAGGDSSSMSQSDQQQQALLNSQQSTTSGQFGALNVANSVYGLTAELLRCMLDYMQHDVSTKLHINIYI